jgi:hypothetical protein
LLRRRNLSILRAFVFLLVWLLDLLYGIFLAYLFPVLREWWRGPTAFAGHAVAAPALQWTMGIMGVLACVSGLLDLAAAYALLHSGWPWTERFGERPRRSAINTCFG